MWKLWKLSISSSNLLVSSSCSYIISTKYSRIIIRRKLKLLCKTTSKLIIIDNYIWLWIIKSFYFWVLQDRRVFFDLNVMFGINVIISLLFFKHWFINYRAALIANKLDNITFVNSIILSYNYRSILLLHSMYFLDTSYSHLLLTTKAY